MYLIGSNAQIKHPDMNQMCIFSASFMSGIENQVALSAAVSNQLHPTTASAVTRGSSVQPHCCYLDAAATLGLCYFMLHPAMEV